jgi:AcrR family transcriptional regulator
MPRKALYNLNQVLTDAIDVFQEHSFHGAVMDELIARTEFNRRGFYLEFSDKRQFLYRVITHYHQQRLSPVLANLESRQGINSIERFFEHYIALIEGKGCLLINCITELGADDTHIKEIGRHYLDSLQIAFIGCLEHATSHKQIKSGVDLESTALQLTCFVQGLAVNALLAESKEEMDLSIQSLLSPLLPNAL